MFEVRARDTAGNVDPTPATWTWFIDTVRPHTTVQLEPGSGPDSGYRFTFAADKPGSTFECALDRASWAVCVSGIVYENLAPGAHEFRVRAIDPAGNADNAYPSAVFAVPEPEPPPAPPADPPPAGEPQPPAEPATVTQPVVPAAPQPPAEAPASSGGPDSGGATTRATPPAPQPPSTAGAAARPVATAPPDAGTLARLIVAGTRSTLDDLPRSRLRSGEAVKVRLVAVVPGRVALTITARTGGRAYTVARAQTSFTAAGTRAVTLRFTPAGRRALRRSGALRLELRAVVAPRAGRQASARAGVRV